MFVDQRRLAGEYRQSVAFGIRFLLKMLPYVFLDFVEGRRYSIRDITSPYSYPRVVGLFFALRLFNYKELVFFGETSGKFTSIHVRDNCIEGKLPMPVAYIINGSVKLAESRVDIISLPEPDFGLMICRGCPLQEQSHTQNLRVIGTSVE